LPAAVCVPLYVKDGRSPRNAQVTGEGRVRHGRVELQVGVSEGDAVVVLEDEEDVPGGEVLAREPVTDRDGDPGDVQRHRRAVQEARAGSAWRQGHNLS
jgi:hypothetical protein